MEPHSGHPLGNNILAVYIGVAFIRGCFVQYTNCSFVTRIPGCYTEVAFIQGWPRGPHCRGIARILEKGVLIEVAQSARLLAAHGKVLGAEATPINNDVIM